MHTDDPEARADAMPWTRFLPAVLAARPRLAGGMLLFAALVLLRLPILTLPPHWDAILGPFAEALWLRAHRFDYWQLITDEPRFVNGGAAIYIWSIVPTLYALLLSVATPRTVFIILHLLNLYLAAVLAVTAYGMMRDLAGAARPLAMVGVAALLLQPAFGGQIDAITMELAAATCALLAANAMLRGRHWRACAWSVFGLLVKDAVLLAAGANLAYAILRVVAKAPATATSPRARRTALPLLVSAALPLLFRGIVVATINSLGPGDAPGAIIALSGSHMFLRVVLARCIPDVLLLYAAALAATVAVVWSARPWAMPTRLAAGCEFVHRLLERLGHVTIHALLTASLFLGAFGVMLMPLPRYVTWYLAFFILALVAALEKLGRQMWPKLALLGTFALLGAVNTHGRLYAELPAPWRRSGELLERSREFLADIRSNRRVAAFLEQHGDAPIVTTCPMDRLLSLPDMGYVDRALDVYSVWTLPTYAPVKPSDALAREDAGRLLVVYAPTVFNWGNPQVDLMPRADDIVLFSDSVRGAPVIVYRLRESMMPQSP